MEILLLKRLDGALDIPKLGKDWEPSATFSCTVDESCGSLRGMTMVEGTKLDIKEARFGAGSCAAWLRGGSGSGWQCCPSCSLVCSIVVLSPVVLL